MPQRRARTAPLLLPLFLFATIAAADARKAHHRPAHHRVARPAEQRPPSPVPTASPTLAAARERISPNRGSSGWIAALVALVGAGAGWFQARRDRARLRRIDHDWRRHAAQLDALLTAEREESDQLRARLAEADRRRAWAQANDVKVTDNQLRFIGEARLYRKQLLNGSEDKIFVACLGFIKARGMRVCPQVSMGEFIGTAEGSRNSANAFSSFNSKRVDLLICDRDWRPLIAVEHQGSGHYQGDAEARDGVKRLALERAGVGLVETFDEDDQVTVRAKLEQELDRIRVGKSSP